MNTGGGAEVATRKKERNGGNGDGELDGGWKEGEVTVGGKGVRGGTIERGCRRKIRGGSYERPVWE